MTQPFELPHFYMPYPARLNPHLEEARAHSTEWAREMGMLEGSGHLGAGRPRRARLRAAVRVHPPRLRRAERSTWSPTGTCGSSSSTTTSWRSSSAPRTATGAQGVPRPAAAVHAGGPSTADPEPTNPVEAGLADLWARTVPAMSVDWRRAVRREHRAPARRVDVGAVQHQRAAGSPTPSSTSRCAARSAARPGRRASSSTRSAPRCPRRRRDAGRCGCCGTPSPTRVHLRNDLFSYQREVEDEGELSNGVLVLETFLGCTTQEAAETVNDLLTSRLHQFEHTALTEVPALFAEHGLDPGEQARRRSPTCKGLQDWQSGGHEWHMRSSRYMNEGGAGGRRGRLRPGRGLGTSAADVARAARRGRRRAAAQLHARARSSAVGPVAAARLLHAVPARRSARTWTAPGDRSSTGRAGWACSTDPDPAASGTRTSSPRLDLAAVRGGHPPGRDAPRTWTSARGWLAWGTYGDDYYPARLRPPPRPGRRARLCTERLSPCMPRRRRRSPRPGQRAWSAAWPTCGGAPPAR